ncbi:MAG: cysteine desulfurase family protein [Candidatus Thorarchaeota archaeon]|jgi:cysteine desulfurase
MKQVYLDYQSAKPVDPRVIEGMTKYLHEAFGNPSALHQVGDVATDALDESRKKVAKFIKADEDEIIFTSGATEAINMGIIGYAMRNKKKGNHIIMSEIEHISIHNIAKHLERQGFEISKVPVGQYGKVNLRKLERRIKEETILITVGMASNEIGTIQPINEIGKLAAEKGITFHTDAVAAQGLHLIDVRKDNINLMALSSNDFYGPRGIGVLYMQKIGVLYMQKKYRVNPLIIGGGQERGLRSGSEDIPGIVGMSLAVDIMKKEMKPEVKRFQGYRDRMIKQVLDEVPDSYLNGHPTDRLASNAHFRFDGIEGESILLSFKDLGISVSTGSACTSKTLEPSHTLIATGLLHEEAHGSLQLTTGRFNTDDDIERAMEVVPQVVSRLRDLSPIYTKK